MEVSAGLNKNGMDVTMVYPEKHLMERLFTPEIAQFYEQYYQDKGVTLMPGSLATEFKGKDGVVSVMTSGPAEAQSQISPSRNAPTLLGTIVRCADELSQETS